MRGFRFSKEPNKLRIEGMDDSNPSIQQLIALARAAAAEAASFQERFAAEDVEARKIVNIMERFLREKGRVVYGGAAINAHMPPAKKFYDPTLNLPDYDFMTPDPLQDCADLIESFQDEGFIDVEAKFGIHEGTYKVFVNYRAAADITFMPPLIYRRILGDSALIDGIQYASVNYLRMNMYLELSRPAGMVSRWEKVYSRLLLLNEEFPLVGVCKGDKDPLTRLRNSMKSRGRATQRAIVDLGIDHQAVFLSGAGYLKEGDEPVYDKVILLMSSNPTSLLVALTEAIKSTTLTGFPAMGELLPARTEVKVKGALVAVVFETVACHSYTTLSEPAGYRLGSLDLLIQMYYAIYFAEAGDYLPIRILCLVQALIDLEASRRAAAVKGEIPMAEAFPMECIGHQPTMPELKKAHRERVAERQAALLHALRIHESFVGRPRRGKLVKHHKN